MLHGVPLGYVDIAARQNFASIICFPLPPRGDANGHVKVEAVNAKCTSLHRIAVLRTYGGRCCLLLQIE